MKTIDADKAIEAIEELRMEYRIPHTDSNGERIHFYERVLIGSEVKGVFDGIIQAIKCIAEEQKEDTGMERMLKPLDPHEIYKELEYIDNRGGNVDHFQNICIEYLLSVLKGVSK